MLLGGAFTKKRIALGCVIILGASAGAGIANVEINGESLSTFINELGKKLFESNNSSQQPSQNMPWAPISLITQASNWIWTVGFSTITQLTSSIYDWVSKKENHSTITSFVTNFWNYQLLEQIVFNFPWTVLAWIKIFLETEMILKFAEAGKRIKTLSGTLVSDKMESESLKMINWLFARFFIHPRKTLNILSRENVEEHLICNGSKQIKGPQGGSPKWLGTCFFENSSKKPLPSNGKLKLKKEIQNFFEKGERSPAKAKP